MRLVDDRLRPRMRRRTVVLPVERRVDHDAFRNRLRVVLVVDLEIGVLVERSARTGSAFAFVPLHRPFDRLRVRVDEQLRRVEAVPGRGVVRAVDAIAVPLAGPDAREIAVPVERRALGRARYASPGRSRRTGTARRARRSPRRARSSCRCRPTSGRAGTDVRARRPSAANVYLLRTEVGDDLDRRRGACAARGLLVDVHVRARAAARGAARAARGRAGPARAPTASSA